MRRGLQLAAAATLLAGSAWAQPASDKIGELRLSLVGLTASVEPAAPVVPKNIASAVRIVVRAGGNELSELEVARLLGKPFEAQAELSGPGLRDTLLLKSLQRDGVPSGDPLLLPLPPLAVAGDYAISNVRLVVPAKPGLDVAPRIPLKVIDQILVTSVKTRPLTLDEIKQKGIVLDKDDYLAFEFTLGVMLNSKPVNFSFPVVFDRDGIEVPQPPTTDVDGVGRQVQRPEVEGGGALIQPIMMALEEEGPGGEKIALTMPDGRPIRIPSVLVIPGNVGYLKQFFSAQLFVANGAPVGSGLVVKDVISTAKLPDGVDGDFARTVDNPLAFPEIERNGQTLTQPATMTIRGVGADGIPQTDDDVDAFSPAEQGQAEFLIRGELEGFHKLDFDIKATLDGLPVGPVKVTGKASGAVLVRNPYFDMTFTVPSVVRAQETFKLFVTLSNVGKGAANDVTVVLDNAAISGAHLACAPDSTEPWCRVNQAGQSEQEIATIAPGDSKTLEYRFVAEKTGKVSAAYLRFETEGGTNNVTGSVAFKLGVGDSGIPLSPDTLVLPAPVDALPADVVAAAMRVLGQAWSLANAPSGSLPAGHARTTQAVVTQKAIALAEAGLRIELRDGAAAAISDSVRDLILDFYGGSPVDPGFDQVLRKTEAGRAFVRALGGALAATATSAGGPLPYERAVAQLAASGPDFLSFSATALPAAELSLLDALGRRSSAGPAWETGVPGLALVPFDPSGGSLLGVLTDPAASPYTLALGPQTAFAVTIPAGDGSFRRITGVTSYRARIVLDLSRPTSLKLEEDADNDGAFELSSDLVPETILPEGPKLLAASVIGPETLPSAGAFGFELAMLFDRVVDAGSAAQTANYAIPNNSVRSARRQLTGRLVFGVLALPEGPHVPTTFSVSGVADPRGAVGDAATVTLKSRLLDPGAVVSGRIVSADGASVPGAATFYANTSDVACPNGPAGVAPIAVLPLDAAGRYELRYVRRNSCGLPFVISTQDPISGNRREVTGVVRNDGERMVLDIALIGRGAVAGTVRTLAGDPVVGAKLLVRSVTDPNQPQNGETDGDGHYRVDNLTVGQVVVEAAKGIGLGRNGGRIFAAGTTATVDVTLDSGAVRVSGRFRKVADGVFTPIARALLSYNVVAAQGGGPAGYTFTDDEGRYAFEGMPVGAFRVAGSGSGVSAFANGVGQLGDDLQNVDLVYEVPTQSNVSFGTVKGFVRLPNGDPAPQGTIVAKDVSGTVIFDGTGVGANGAFQMNGVKVGVQESLGAVTKDGRRRGYTTFTIDPVTREVENVIITLSGLGTAQFTVRDPQGQPLANQEVRLLGFGLSVGGCHDPCGCTSAKTDVNGIAKFEGLALGNYQVQALRAGPGYMDVARGSASVVGEGQTGFGQIQFRGVGSVTGEIKSTAGVVLQGGSLTMSSSVFVNDGQFTCGLVHKESHAGPIDPSTNKFSFKNVLVGPVSISATNEFAPTPVGASGTLTTAGEQLFFTLQFVDTTAGELSGKVFYPDGVTPAGAGVEVTTTGALPEVKVKTDAQGAFHFAKIFPQGSYAMVARDPATGGVAREYVYLQAQQDLHHDLRLKGTGTVRVRVVDGADQPVSEAFVKLRESDFPNRAFEAPIGVENLGVASIEGVFEGGFSVEVSDPNGRGGRGSGTLPRPGDSVEIKVRLTSTGKVKGHVLMPDATPSDLDNPRVPFAVVTLAAGGRRIGQVTTPGSDDTSTPDVNELGYFTFDYVPAGAVRVEVQDPLTLRSGFATGSIDTEGQLLTLDAKLQGLGTVSGTVTRRDAGGEPTGAGGAHVDLISGGYTSCTFADGTGRYSVSGVPEGRVTVTAALSTGNSLGNFLAATASGTLSGEGGELTLDVALRDSGEVTGQVLRPDGVTAGPISTVQVSVGGFGGATQSTTTDEQGRFHFERVPAGAATLTVDVLGSIDKAKKSFEVPAGVIDVPVPLNGIGPLRGVAFDSSGTAPIAGDVTLTGSGAFPYTEYVRAGSTGQYVWPELLAGPVTLSLRVQQGGLTLYGSASGELVAGQPNILDVKLQDTGTVIGVLKREDGVTPAYGTDVTLQRVANGATLALQAQNDGSFMAKGMPLGAFTFKARDPLTGGVALVTGRSVAANGEIVDLETIVLDNSPVAVVSVDPPDGAQGIAVNRPIQIVFTDPLKHTSGVSLKNDTAGVGFVPSLSADRKTLTLTGSWPDARELTLEVGAGVTDIHDRHPAQAFSSRFRTVDLSPPQVLTVTPANLAIQVDPGAVVTVTFNEPLSESTNFATLVTLSGGVAGTTVLASPTSVVFTPASPLASNGSYTVTVNGALDLSGNQQTGAFPSSFKTLDTIAPALAVTSPSVAWVKQLRPPLTVSLSDAGSGIDTPTSELLLDGVPIPNPFRASSFVSFTPTSDLAQGPHAVAASVRDRAGNLGSTSGSFGVDTIAPEPAVLTGVSEGGLPIKGTIVLGGVASDPAPGSGIAKIEILRGGSLIATAPEPGFTVSYNTHLLSEGPHVLSARAVDKAGNVGPQGPPVNVIVDNQVLSVAITLPAANTRVRDSLRVTATTSENATVEFRIGTLSLVDDEPPYDKTFDLATLDAGSHTVEAIASAVDGDVAVAPGIPIFLDRTPPLAPLAARITAEESDPGFSQVAGLSSAVEGGATVEVRNVGSGVIATTLAAQDGSFSVRIQAVRDDEVDVTAIDTVLNRGPTTRMTVSRTVSPGGVPLVGLQLWTSADPEGMSKHPTTGAVSLVADRSGHDNHLFQGTPASQPIWIENGFNGWPVLRFDGSNDFVRFTTRLGTIRTVFWVVKEDNAATHAQRSLLGHDSPVRDFEGASGAPGALWRGDCCVSSFITEGQTWLNGALVDGRSTQRPRTMSVISLITTGSVSADKFGTAYVTSPWWGDLAELLIYDRPLSAGERQTVEDYLVAKYRPYPPSVATPAIAPSGGAFSGSTTVTLGTSTSDAEIRYTLDGQEPSTSSQLYAEPFVITETTTVKAKAFRAGFLDSVTATASFVETEESPVLTAAGLSLWLRADAGIPTNGGGWVTTWIDQSGQGQHATQSNGLNAPRFVPNAVNGLPALRFDGSNDFLRFTTGLGTIRTVFWVVKEDSAASHAQRSLLGHESPVRDFEGGSGAPGMIWRADCCVSSFITSGQTYLNGVPVDGRTTPRPRTMSVISLVTTGNVSADKFGLAYVTAGWWGDLAELVIYDRPLTSPERKSVEDYLLSKYALGTTVTRPFVTPHGGTFTGSLSVIVQSTTPGASVYYTLDGSEPTEASLPYTGPFEIVETTTVKVKAWKAGLEPSGTVTAGFTNTADTSPKTVSGLKLWWRADAGTPTNAGDFWQDQSGSENHGVQTFSGSAPVLVPNAVNGLPALRFDGSNDFLRFTTGLGTIRTVFWVVKEDGAASHAQRSLLGHESPVRDFEGGTGAPGMIWRADCCVSSFITSGQTYLNGVPVDGRTTPRPRTMSVISLVTTGNVSADKFGLAYVTAGWWGDLAELVIYDRPLTSPERKTIEDYLLSRYALGTTVTRPFVTPHGGTFTGSLSVSVQSTTPGASVHYTLDGSEPTAVSPAYAGPFLIFQTTTVKVKAFMAGLIPSGTVTAGFTNTADTSPKSVSGLKLWWRADAGTPTNSGDFWEDQSGSGNHGVQSFSGSTPLLIPNAVNGLPMLRFDGSNDFVRFTTGLGTIRTVFWVVKEDSAASQAQRSLLGHESPVRDFEGGSGAPGMIWRADCCVSSFITSGQTYLNGELVNGRTTPRPRTMSVISLATTGNVSADKFGLAYVTAGWWGDLAELVIYDAPLSAADRLKVENYLRIKYWDVTATPGAGSVTLSWMPQPPIGVRYDVERSTTSGTGYSTVATGLLATAHTDTSVVPLTTYYYRIVAVDGSGNRFPSREVASSSISAGDGSGLTGTYYGNPNLADSPTLIRVDDLVDFSFGTGAADGVNADNFSVRWSGQLQAPATGDFVFATNSDDGVRLRIDGQLVINNWTDHGDTLNTSEPVRLEVGRMYDVELEYYDRTGGALIRLKWAYPGQTVYQTIPKAQLRP